MSVERTAGIPFSNLIYEHWLCNIHKNIGPATRRRLRAVFGGAEQIYQAEFRELCQRGGLKESQAHGIVESRHQWDLDDFLLLKEKQIWMVTEEMEEFPKRLKPLPGMPDVLYVRGELPKEETPTVAIVGARRATNQGRGFAEELGAALGLHGVQVVSGLARGVDGCAHRGALRVEAKTYGVLGCGVDICYPREHIQLYTQMQHCGGVLSEYPPGTQGLASHFPARNRIVSGLADVVIVVEAKERSGALITAEFALEQGKEIMAVPGRIWDSNSAGCNRLIQDGAALLQRPEEVLELLGVGGQGTVNLSCIENISLASDEKLVYSCLDSSPVGLEELVLKTGLPPANILSALLQLELKGMICEQAKHYYCKMHMQK